MKRGIVAVAAALGIASFAAPAHACSCYPPTYEEAFEASNGVFDGTVIGVVETSTGGEFDVPYLEVTFEVHASWKGVTTRYYTVLTPADDGMCGATLPLDTRHVVFVEDGMNWIGDGVEGPSTHSCTRNQPYESAASLLEWLGEPTVVPVETGTWGGIKARYGDMP